MSETNGENSRENLKAARRKVRILREQIEARQLEVQAKLLENLWGWGGWDGFGGSDLWDRFRPKTNSGEPGWGVPPNVPFDRAHGAYWPFWRNQWELDALRQQSRVRAESNSFGIGLLDNLTNNVVGKGFTYKVMPKLGKNSEGKTREPQPDELAQIDRVQAFIDQWCKRNRWNGTVDPQALAICGSREREIYQTIKKDGECFVRFHKTEGGLEVSFLNAEQVRSGNPGTAQEGWFVGIRHQMEPYENVEKPEQYAVFWPDPSATGGKEGEPQVGQFSYIDAEEILHLKGVNTPANVARGLPLFIFDCGAALDRAAKLQLCASVGATVQASNAEIWQVANQTQAQVSSMAGALATAIGPASRGETGYVERRQPGTVRRIPEGMELTENAYSHAAAYMEAKNGDLEQAAAAACAPSFWLGPHSESNYSNLESAAAPAVRAGICEQEYMKTACAAVVWRAILFGEEKGILPRGISERIDLKVDAPAVLHRNELEKAQEDQIGITVGWLDRQTAAASRGLDFDHVMENNKEYQEEMPQPAAPGGEGGEKKPAGMTGVTPDASLPKAPMPHVTRESVEARIMQLVQLTEAEDTSGHAHDSAGKFTSKAHSASKTAHEVSLSVSGFKSGDERPEEYTEPASSARKSAHEANKASKSGDHALAFEHHKDAANHHEDAAEAHSLYSGPGNPVGHLHQEAEKLHRRAALSHQKAKDAHKATPVHESAEDRIAWLKATYGEQEAAKIVGMATRLLEGEE